MDINEYFNQKKSLYESILTFLECEEDENAEYSFQEIVNLITNQDIQNKHEEFNHFLRFISKISSNHHRNLGFINKIEKIILYFKDSIKKAYSNSELFNIFSDNKLILLFLVKQQLITKLLDFQKSYVYFFFPEIKASISKETADDIEDELLKIDQNIFDNYEEKREKGENDSYICTLIQDDAVEEFISFTNRSNTPLSMKITPSISEYCLLSSSTINDFKLRQF